MSICVKRKKKTCWKIHYSPCGFREDTAPKQLTNHNARNLSLVETVVGECIRVHDNKAVHNQMKPIDIDNWYYHIMKVALRSKASNNSNITWMEYGNTTFPIKESPYPRVAHVQPWRQIAKSPNTNNTNRLKTLPISIQSRPFLLTRINVNSSMDK